MAAKTLQHYHFSLIPSGLVVLPEKNSLIPEAGCGQSPQKMADTNAFIVMQKNSKTQRNLHPP